MIIIIAEPGKKVHLGRIGENEARAVQFDISQTQAEFPGASFSVLNMRPQDPDAYPVNGQFIRIEGSNLYWTLQSGDLTEDGLGECELKATVDGVIVKSEIWTTEICPALDGNGTPPEPWESWQQQVEDDADRAEAAAELLEHPGAEAETLPAGSQATASYDDGVFHFGIPKGDTGEDGYSPTVRMMRGTGRLNIYITDKNGTKSSYVDDGKDGRKLAMGSVSTLETGEPATAEIIDNPQWPEMYLNLGLPKGNTGDQGEQGETGETPIISIGTVSTLPAGSSATASMDTTDPEHPVLSMGIPKGDPGEVTEAELTAATTELKSAIQQKADIITDTVQNVAVASVPDAAANLPLSALKIAIDPIQDLHGHESPWPAGGGENILDPNLRFTAGTYYGVAVIATADGYNITLSGTPTESGNITTNNIPTADAIVMPAGTYTSVGAIFSTYKADGSWYTNRQVGTWTADEPFIVRQAYIQAVAGTPISGSRFIALVKGSTAPTLWTPYSNICPITGWTGCNVARTGVNLCSSAIGRYLWSNGVRYVNGTAYCATEDKIQIAGGQTYTVSLNNTGVTSSIYVAWYQNGAYLKQDSISVAPYIYTAPDNATECTITIRNNSDYTGDPTVTNLQIELELGSTAHAYTPFVGSTIPISWQDEAGTVYGGTVTVNQDGSGELVVDKFLYAYDGTEYFNKSGTALNGFYNQLTAATRPHNWPKMFDYNQVSTLTDEKSSMFIVTRNVNTYKQNYGYCFIDSGHNFNVPPETFGTTVESFKAKLAELYAAGKPVSVFCKIAEPQVYQLTNQQVVSLLKGQNNLWADTGNVIEMTYPCDTKLFIEKKIAELQALILES